MSTKGFIAADRFGSPQEIQAGAFPIQVTRATCIAELSAAEWDGLVPRDVPHLRYGFLQATEESGFGKTPYYVCARRDGELVGVTAAYAMSVDLLTLAPPAVCGPATKLRRFWPGFLFLKALLCGPLVTNCNHNFYIDPGLSTSEQQSVADALLRDLDATRAGSLVIGIEFTGEEADKFAPVMERRGYIRAHSLPGNALPVRWKNLDEYIGKMRKAFRRTVVKDRSMAELDITFEVVEDFSDLADVAHQLYSNVLAKADHVFEKLTPAFFRALAKFEQSRLVVARHRHTNEVVGIELLLLGDNVLQDLYTGLDYTYNESHRLYFNLLYPVIDFAGKSGVETLALGQTSYTFKSRLGAEPYRLYIFAKARNPVFHRILASMKSALFPDTPMSEERPHVFRDGAHPDTTGKYDR